MSTPTISLLTPTQGRPTLERMLASGVGQLRDGDEWLIVVDCHELGLADFVAVGARVAAFGPAVRLLGYDAGGHDWGHSQLNFGMGQARGAYLTFLDDDDCVADGALDAIRDAAAALPEPGPLLFRFMANFGRVVWQRRGVSAPGMIGGHCLVAPNMPDLLGCWGASYEGDYEFVAETLARWANCKVDPVWVDRIIYRQRDQ